MKSWSDNTFFYFKRPENDDDADPLDDNADDCDYSIEKLGIGFKLCAKHLLHAIAYK